MYNNINNIKINISYTTNFKPANFLYFNNLKIFRNNNKNKIISRNFFLFLILLKYSNSNYNTDTSIFVKPRYKKFITLLRAPYRYKLARHQFMFSRYYVLLTIKFKLEKLFFKNTLDLIYFLNFVKQFYV